MKKGNLTTESQIDQSSKRREQYLSLLLSDSMGSKITQQKIDKLHPLSTKNKREDSQSMNRNLNKLRQFQREKQLSNAGDTDKIQQQIIPKLQLDMIQNSFDQKNPRTNMKDAILSPMEQQTFYEQNRITSNLLLHNNNPQPTSNLDASYMFPTQDPNAQTLNITNYNLSVVSQASQNKNVNQSANQSNQNEPEKCTTPFIVNKNANRKILPKLNNPQIFTNPQTHGNTNQILSNSNSTTSKTQNNFKNLMQSNGIFSNSNNYNTNPNTNRGISDQKQQLDYSQIYHSTQDYLNSSGQYGFQQQKQQINAQNTSSLLMTKAKVHHQARYSVDRSQLAQNPLSAQNNRDMIFSGGDSKQQLRELNLISPAFSSGTGAPLLGGKLMVQQKQLNLSTNLQDSSQNLLNQSHKMNSKIHVRNIGNFLNQSHDQIQQAQLSNRSHQQQQYQQNESLIMSTNNHKGMFRNRLASTNIQTRPLFNQSSPQHMNNLNLSSVSPLYNQQISASTYHHKKQKFVRPYFLEKIDDIMNQSQQTQASSANNALNLSMRKVKIKEQHNLVNVLKDMEIKLKQRRKEIDRMRQVNQLQQSQLQQDQSMNAKLTNKLRDCQQSTTLKTSPRYPTQNNHGAGDVLLESSRNQNSTTNSHQTYGLNETSVFGKHIGVMDQQQQLILDSARTNITTGLNQIKGSTQKSQQSQPKNNEKEIHQIYSLYFENDLQNVKQRAIDQLQSFKQKTGSELSNLESLRYENFQLEKTLKRYKDLLNDPNLQKNLIHRQKMKAHGVLKHKDTIMKLQDDTLSQVSNSIMLDNLEDINMKVQKYQRFQKSNNIGQDKPLSGLSDDRVNMTQSNAAPAFVELSKLEKFNMIWPQIYKAQKPLDLIISFLSELKNIFKPNKLTLFIINEHIQEQIIRPGKERKRNTKKLQMSLNIVYAVFNNEDDFCGPVFKTIEESESLIRTQTVMMIPIFMEIDQKMTHIFSLQIEQDLSKEQNDMQQLYKKMGHKTRKKLPMHLSKGWNYNDQNLAKIMIEFFLTKLVIQLKGMKLIEKSEQVDQIIQFAQDISRRKTYRQLIRGLKREFVKLTGFQDIGLLFFDEKLQELFTVSTEIQEKHLVNIDKANQQEKGKNKSPKKTVANAKADKKRQALKLAQELEAELNIKIEEELIFPTESVVKFPSTVGITGEIFKNASLMYSNYYKVDAKPENDLLHKRREKLDQSNMKQHPNMQTISSTFSRRRGSHGFNCDVDNYMGVKQIKNFMIASMNDHDDFDQKYSLGVIQLFNKSSSITDEDQIRIESLQRFLGAAVTRVKTITGSLTVVVGLNMIMEQQSQGLDLGNTLICTAMNQATMLQNILNQMELWGQQGIIITS
eukprot:403358761